MTYHYHTGDAKCPMHDGGETKDVDDGKEDDGKEGDGNAYGWKCVGGFWVDADGNKSTKACTPEEDAEEVSVEIPPSTAPLPVTTPTPLFGDME